MPRGLGRFELNRFNGRSCRIELFLPASSSALGSSGAGLNQRGPGCADLGDFHSLITCHLDHLAPRWITDAGSQSLLLKTAVFTMC